MDSGRCWLMMTSLAECAQRFRLCRQLLSLQCNHVLGAGNGIHFYPNEILKSSFKELICTAPIMGMSSFCNVTTGSSLERPGSDLFHIITYLARAHCVWARPSWRCHRLLTFTPEQVSYMKTLPGRKAELFFCPQDSLAPLRPHRLWTYAIMLTSQAFNSVAQMLAFTSVRR